MTQNVQDLIRKIKTEGLEAGRQKSQEIEQEAQKKAEALIAQAQADAEKIIAGARAEQEKIEQASRASLGQAARDTVLALRETINDLLMKIIRQDVREALGKEQMTALIVELSKQFISGASARDTVEVGLKEDDRAALENSLVSKLQKEIKAGVSIRTEDDLTGGFTISFDQGKSCFDFSEETMVTYLSRYVNQYVAGLMK